MLEGLNAIPWAELTHAYGSAEEVPMWLRRLTSEDAKVRKEAMNDLWGSICHQNWICPATGYAVPYLIELLQEPSIQDKDRILGLLADIASCGPLHEPRWRDGSDVRSWVVPAHIPFKDTHAEAAAGIPVYVSLLKHEQLQVPMQAAKVLRAFPERATEIWPIVAAAYERATDEAERANLLLALGRLSQPVPGHLRLFEDLVRSSESELMRFVAALALAYSAKDQTPQDAADLLANVMEQGHPALPAYRGYQELACGGGYPCVAARLALYRLGPVRMRSVIPLLIDMIQPADDSWALIFMEMLLYIVFDGKGRWGHEPRPATALTDEQRAVLEVILDTENAWKTIGNVANDMAAYGLPGTREEMATYLGREDVAAALVQASEQRPTPPRRPQGQDRFQSYAQHIKESFPDLHIRNYRGKLYPPGQNNDVITVNHHATSPSVQTVIFRFPLHARALEEMEREIAILRGLQGRLPLPIPDPAYSSQGTREVGRVFMGYEKLPGKPLYREMLESVDGEETVQRLATQLAEFLRALHSVPADAFAIALRVTNSRATWALMYERTREQLFPHMRPDAREQVSAHFEWFLDDPRNFEWTPVLIHGDFGPSNILYDAKRRTISGIIDFSSAGLGDPATDLAALIAPHSYGEDFPARLESGYPGIADLVDRANFYMGTFALQEALFGVEHDDREAFERGIGEYA